MDKIDWALAIIGGAIVAVSAMSYKLGIYCSTLNEEDFALVEACVNLI